MAVYLDHFPLAQALKSLSMGNGAVRPYNQDDLTLCKGWLHRLLILECMQELKGNAAATKGHHSRATDDEADP